VNLPFALQLYSLRRETAGHAEAVLRQVPSLGYDSIELAGSYGWTPEQWRKLLDETGLTVVGAHHRLDDLEAQMPFHRAIGNRRLVVPSLPKDLDYRQAAQRLNTLGQRAKDEGFALYYHNHAFELEDAGIDILLAETDPNLVAFEVDTYWVERAGRNALDFIQQHLPRIGMIHAKDYRKRDGANVPAGQGDVDFPAIVPLARENAWPVIVEYEGENALAAVAESARYLRAL
jgi:sugar phosphate isomerase/epimerase